MMTRTSATGLKVSPQEAVQVRGPQGHPAWGSNVDARFLLAHPLGCVVGHDGIAGAAQCWNELGTAVGRAMRSSPHPSSREARLSAFAGTTDDGSALRVELPQVPVAGDLERAVSSGSFAGLGTHFIDGRVASPNAARHHDHDGYDDHRGSGWLRQQRAKTNDREHKDARD
jgi:hypothetical protein